MIDCKEAREELALASSNDNDLLHTHLVQCADCARYCRHQQALDTVLRAELYWEAPAALTAQLLSFASSAVARTPAHLRPKGWYITLIYILTMLSISLSLVVAWQFLTVLAGELRIGQILTQLIATVTQEVAQITQMPPEMGYIAAFFERIRNQLLYLLLVAVLWITLDKWNGQFKFRHPQLPS